MSRSLVLNATFEPLGVVNDRRAVVLVLAEKAECVHTSGRCLHSEHLAVDIPSVIRLRRYVRVPYRRHTALSRRAVFCRDGGRCQYCGSAAETIDHVIPKSRGGQHAWDNVVAACRRCNAAKSDRLLSQTTMSLSRRPSMPEGLAWLTVRLAEVPDQWQQYLGDTTLMPAPPLSAAS